MTTNAGESIGYETLVLATGCGVIRLPAAMGGELPGVRYVRDNADGLALAARGDGEESRRHRRRIHRVRGRRVVRDVVETEVIMMEPHVMGRLWNADIAKHYGVVQARGPRSTARAR